MSVARDVLRPTTGKFTFYLSATARVNKKLGDSHEGTVRLVGVTDGAALLLRINGSTVLRLRVSDAASHRANTGSALPETPTSGIATTRVACSRWFNNMAFSDTSLPRVDDGRRACTHEAGSTAPGTDLRGDCFRGDIEGLRGIAVLAVVGYHAGLLSIRPTRSEAADRAGLGGSALRRRLSHAAA